MNRCPLTIGTMIVIAWVLACTAAAAPPAVNNFTGQTSFTPQEQDDIAAYVQYWCDEMTSTGENAPSGVSAARRRLLEPIRLSTTEFRLVYSNAITPLLRDAVAGENQHIAVNALTVLQELGTDRALDVVQDFCSRSDEPRMPIRLTATRACGKLMNGRNVSATRVRAALRTIRGAVEEEEDGIVLRRQLEALLGVRGPEAAEARSRVAQALEAVLDRFDNRPEPPEADMLRAIDSVLPDLRHAYLNLPGADQTSLGRELAGPLVKALGLAQGQWEEAHKNPEKLKRLYARIILVSEQILKQIDPRVRPGQQTPTTALHRAWQDANKDRYEADWRRWRSVVRPPAYGSP
ncbi:MAG: hypothetical protein JSV91_13340 [Phycisphaerales bacterium]|nr:MAG: hypothetical protein JSV91_13340 [Phycisphaerales bacterium]